MKMIKYFARLLLAISLLTFLPGWLSAQDTLQIDGIWKFHKGDNKQWSTKNHDDKTWTNIETGKHWEQQGYDEYDGFAWYRKHIHIPAAMKAHLNAPYHALSLCIGQIDDCDQVWINGHLIGQTGDMTTEESPGSYRQKREYPVDAQNILWGEDNVIAVRVRDINGNGGLYNGPYYLRTAKWTDYVAVETDINGHEGILRTGEAQITFSLENHSPEDLSGKLTYRLETCHHEVLKKEYLPFTVKKKGRNSYTLTYPVERPGFYEVHFEYLPAGKARPVRVVQYFGVTPDQIDVPLTRPDDFQAYWDNARRELALVPPRFKLTEDKAASDDQQTTYLLEMRSLGDVLVRGFYVVPKNHKAKLPAILRVQGYSSYQRAAYIPGFATLSLNIRGHGNSRDEINPGFPGYLQYNIHDKNRYIYRGAYMDCLRAVDFLCTQTNIDTSRLVVMGGSQGGALSFATAALDSRIDLCCPRIPFLSSFRDYFVITPWPGHEFEAYIKQHPESSWSEVYQVLDYIDIKNLAPWINCPVFMGVGLQDRTCPPFINFAAFNQIGSLDKQWRVYEETGHYVPQRHGKEEMQWIKKHLKME